MTRRPSRPGPRLPASHDTTWFRVLCLVTAVLYSAWLVGPWLNPDLDEMYGYVSELSARDQPFNEFFRTTDVTSGTLVLLTAALGFRWWHQTREARRGNRLTGWLGWGGMAAFGLATLVDASLTPMACAVYVEPGCAVREIVGTLPVTHQLHQVSSGVAFTAVLIAMAGLGLTVRGARGPMDTVVAAIWFSVTAVTSLAVLAALVWHGWAGLFQRLQLGLIAGWLAWLAFALPGIRRRG